MARALLRSRGPIASWRKGLAGSISANAEWGRDMGSTWWLLGALIAGGCLGLMLFALLAMAHDSDGTRDLKIAHRRAAPHGAVKEGVSPS